MPQTRRYNPRPLRRQRRLRRPRRPRSPSDARPAGPSRAPAPRRSHARNSRDRVVTLSPDLIWVIARSTGTASLVALTLSVLTGIALRTGTFAWLSHNRGVRVVHGFLTVLWIPLG